MINSEKENKKAAADALLTGDSLQPPHIYVSYYSLLCLVHVVVYNESLCE